MSNCKNICSLCPRLIISTAVNFDAATNALLINIPAQTYSNNCKYCIVVAQAIPTTTRINSLVFITVTGSTTRFPLVACGCEQVTACQIRTRTKYSTVVNTNTVSGVFRLCGRLCGCSRATSDLPSLPITPVVATEPDTPAVQNAIATRTASATPKKAKSSTVDSMTVNASNVTVNKEDK